MDLEQSLMLRSGSQCELCAAKENLQVYEVPHYPEGADNNILICSICEEQIVDPDKTDPNHWRCLNDSMWSTVAAVQVVAWRMLERLKSEGWPQDLLDMMYMEDDVREWARSGRQEEQSENQSAHKDSNGTILENGDTVVLIKDLPVKGSSMVAKRGTAVRRISLVHDNPEHIEGRVDSQQIVILTKFVKKS